ncbi:MAG: HEPN domain-containing protein [Candidatus Coatesbacteria bacterium]|nr:HEPN domain-containing protein [Candidatus Coatesbacteria bacterium]
MVSDSDSQGQESKIRSWIAGAEEALEVAHSLLSSGKFVFSVFFCHLAIEKTLKAAVIAETGNVAPKTHNLRYLSGQAGLPAGGREFEFISILSDVSVPTRYPEDLGHSLSGYTEDVVRDYLERTREAIDWIKTFM